MPKYEKEIVIPRPEVDHVTKLCFKGPSEPGEVKPGSYPYTWSETFEDGCRVEVMVCADEEDPTGSPCWVDGRLLDGEGRVLQEQDDDTDRPWGGWFFWHGDCEYTLTLTPET